MNSLFSLAIIFCSLAVSFANPVAEKLDESNIVLINRKAGASRLYAELESDPYTNWGDWGTMDLCPEHTYVTGFASKVEPYQGMFKDDTAMNGIFLRCSGGTSVRSSEGQWGTWGPVAECPAGKFVVGFQMLVEEEMAMPADNTATNAIRLYCDDRSVLRSAEMTFGKWSPVKFCPTGYAFCGVKTQVQAKTLTGNTALNNVKFACCDD